MSGWEGGTLVRPYGEWRTLKSLKETCRWSKSDFSKCRRGALCKGLHSCGCLRVFKVPEFSYISERCGNIYYTRIARSLW